MGKDFRPDPRGLPGVQPHPLDMRFHHTPGIVFKLALTDSKGLQNESEYITEWVVKLCATPIALATVRDGSDFGFSALIVANYIGEQFQEYQAPDGENIAIPYVGICLPFHARSVNIQLARSAPTAGIGSVRDPMEMIAAIVPGRVAVTYPRRGFTVPEGAPNTIDVKLATFAQRFTIDGPLAVGDTIDQRHAGVSVWIVTLTAAMISTGWLPVHPEATFVRVGSATSKKLILCMEVIS